MGPASGVDGSGDVGGEPCWAEIATIGAAFGDADRGNALRDLGRRFTSVRSRCATLRLVPSGQSCRSKVFGLPTQAQQAPNSCRFGQLRDISVLLFPPSDRLRVQMAIASVRALSNVCSLTPHLRARAGPPDAGRRSRPWCRSPSWRRQHVGGPDRSRPMKPRLRASR